MAFAIKHKRLKKGWSARRTSELAGLSSSYISKVEAGEVEPSMRAFAKIAHVLDMTNAEVLILLRAAANDITVTPRP